MRTKGDVIREINGLLDQKDALVARIRGLKEELKQKPTKRIPLSDDEPLRAAGSVQYPGGNTIDREDFDPNDPKYQTLPSTPKEDIPPFLQNLPKTEAFAHQDTRPIDPVTGHPVRRRRTKEEMAASLARAQASVGIVPTVAVLPGSQSAPPTDDPEAYVEPKRTDRFEVPTAPPPWET